MLIKRETYLRQLRQLRDINLIKIFTGMRRVGKSTLMQLFAQELRASGVAPACIQSCNFEDPGMTRGKADWRQLYDAILAKCVAGKMNYIFLDEVQIIPQFERLVDGLFIQPDIDLYVTGSNAYLLSGELATYLTGRYISTNVLPLSFAEYAGLFPTVPKSELLSQYLKASSLPEGAKLGQAAPEFVTRYLRDIYDTVVEKDIARRHSIRDIGNFERVYKFALDSIGSFVSPGNIATALNSGLRKGEPTISHHTIDTYLGYMTDAWLLYKADRYDIKGKRLLKTRGKYYTVDLGLRTALTGGKPDADLGHKLENIVFLELRRRNIGDIQVGKHDDQEVDFVVQNSAGERSYYQVAWNIHDEQTLDRELAPLRRIRDHYPKFLITNDSGDANIDGIQKINTVDWLSNPEQP
ncbi:MAG: ATP-binding protein [Opitutaceae bacterium]|nr:ATP-binding protein [Opitutaceae bacterium]